MRAARKKTDDGALQRFLGKAVRRMAIPAAVLGTSLLLLVPGASAQVLYGQALSVCAGPPLAGAMAFQNGFPVQAFDRAAACNKWARSCKGIAGNRAGCLRGAMAKRAGLQRAECKTFMAAEACLNATKADFDAGIDLVKSGLDSAKVFCATTGTASCLGSCATVP